MLKIKNFCIFAVENYVPQNTTFPLFLPSPLASQQRGFFFFHGGFFVLIVLFIAWPFVRPFCPGNTTPLNWRNIGGVSLSLILYNLVRFQ